MRNPFKSEAFSWLRAVALDPVGGMGLLLATIGGMLFAVFLFLAMLGFPFSHYIGIFIYIILPAVLFLGLILIPLGRWRIGRRYPGGRLPQFDFENPRHLKKLGVFLALSVVNVCFFGLASYEAYHLSDSNEFCGRLCHQVMEPEWAAYQDSPHSRVDCVSCHIGPGAGWFVRSKLSGARQVLAVATGDYHRPIETPIHNLRPARETCEQCHWPEKFHGEKLKVIERFQEDEENTSLQTVLLMRVGGGTRNGEPVGGIHWHTNSANRIEYVSTDDSREEIPWMQLETPDGEIVEYVADGYDESQVQELLQTRPRRTMDCMDCHNRPTHTFESVDDALDRALANGRLDRSIPFLRRNAARVLQTEVGRDDDARQKIREALEDLYGGEMVLSPELLEETTAGLLAIWSRNVFPAMEIQWGTYPNFLGHGDGEGGCFRCHAGDHTSTSGRTIPDDCETCHGMLAWEEEDPDILSELSLGTR
jgi:nitrate/TMAO reductase-like tetraheme cytochrome c subunit